MEQYELRDLIVKGETQHVEFKEILPDNETIAQLLVCFSNADGGRLIIGVDDRGRIVGFDKIDEASKKIDDISFNRCEPPIKILIETVEIDDLKTLVVTIPKGTQRPYRTKSGKYYIRSGNRCRQASWEEVRRLYQFSESIYYDEAAVPRASYDDLDLQVVEEFMKKHLPIQFNRDVIDQYMRNIKIITSDMSPTLAGILFFGIDPQKFFPFAKITAAYFPGHDLSTPPSDKKDLNGRIPEIIEKAAKFLRLYLKEEHRIKAFESERYPELPEEALRESIVNAIAHRDYTVSAPIRLFAFTDRIEVRTPGRLPNTVTVESMKTSIHVLRNPVIYNLLYRHGLVTDVGSGIPRIINLIKKYIKKEVDLVETDSEFKLTIPRV